MNASTNLVVDEVSASFAEPAGSLGSSHLERLMRLVFPVCVEATGSSLRLQSGLVGLTCLYFEGTCGVSPISWPDPDSGTLPTSTWKAAKLV